MRLRRRKQQFVGGVLASAYQLDGAWFGMLCVRTPAGHIPARGIWSSSIPWDTESKAIDHAYQHLTYFLLGAIGADPSSDWIASFARHLTDQGAAGDH